jgi:8-amino-7-oxononanoate synthase
MSVLDLFEKLGRWSRYEDVVAAGVYPYFRAIESSQNGTWVTIDGREVVMAGSNNYLGLTHDPRVMEASRKAITDFGTGCTGSRLLNGTMTLHEELEERLARFLGKDACITSGTGYQTNVGMLAALTTRGDLIYGDRDNHASLIDGCRLSYGRLFKYAHNDMAELEGLLANTTPQGDGSRLILTDGVFSMLGDMAPLPAMVELRKRFGARLMVDDAHAVGVLGAHGRGTGEHFGVEDDVDLVVGTFSKSFACLGGFLAGPKKIIDFLKHNGRSVLFSASMTPASVAAVLACLDIVETEPERRERLFANVEYMRKGFEDLGLTVIEAGTPILSVLIGEDLPTLEFNRLLFAEGVFVNPVLPPGVPPGMSLLRTSYMATHNQEDLDTILAAFRTVSEKLGIAR